MASFLLDSDVVIWFLRGEETVVSLVLSLAHQGRLGVSAITRAEVIQGMREPERQGTFEFLDACETLPVGPREADRAAEFIRATRGRGITLHLPDALIGATALSAQIPLYTANARHFPLPDLEVRAVKVV